MRRCWTRRTGFLFATLLAGALALAACAGAPPPAAASLARNAASPPAAAGGGGTIAPASKKQSNWVYFGSDAAGTFDLYADINNVRVRDSDGLHYMVIVLAHGDDVAVASGETGAMNVDLIAFDCRRRLFDLVAITSFSAAGELVYEVPPGDVRTWSPIGAASMVHDLYRYACHGALPNKSPATAMADARIAAALRPSTPRRAAPKLSAAEVYRMVKDSVWMLASFRVRNGDVDRKDISQGSAVAIGPDTLLTNCHTLAGKDLHAIFQDGGRVVKRVTIRSADRAADRCVLAAEEPLPTYVRVAPYAEAAIGDEVYSIGSPRGYELTIGNGILSAKRRIKGIDYLQTTAPISPGSSGGGLFDAYGRLVGITTFLLAESQNLNFAIAADSFYF